MFGIRRSVGLVATVFAIGSALPAQDRPAAPSSSVVGLAATYVAEYHTRFPFLVADEEYVQIVLDGAGLEQQRRTLRGELFLTYLEFDNEWIAVHDFATTGGRPVPDRQDLRAMLQKSPTGSVLRDVAARNSRFNIGTVERDFNEPTLPLLVLEPKRIDNFRFSQRTVKPDGATALTALDFIERARPTIVDSNGRDPVFSSGEVVVETATGRIRSTRMAFQIGELRAELSTTYTLDRVLDLWVPSRFEERYQRIGIGNPEVIRCEAKLTNYRKFGATVRIR